MTGRDAGPVGSAVDHVLRPSHAQIEGMVRLRGWLEEEAGPGPGALISFVGLDQRSPGGCRG